MNTRIAAAAALVLAAGLAFGQAQKAPAPYEPTSGQEGKDVVWIPTPQIVADRMLELAKVKPGDFLMDLGSGDGRLVITAAKRGARAMGVEYNKDMVEYAKRSAEKEGVADKVTFVKADLFETDFSKATVVTMFLLPSINLKLRPKLLAMKPGTRVVSNTFNMGDWNADDTAELGPEGCNSSWCTALLWIVPAQVAGLYNVPQGDILLKQTFQNLSGTITAGGKTYALTGKVRGEDISFVAGGKTYRGRVNGKALELR